VRILVIGTGLVGGAAVTALSKRGHEVIGVSRSSSPAVDATDPQSISALFDSIESVDAVVAALGSAPYEPLGELGHDDFVQGLLAKALSQIDIVLLGTPYLTAPGPSRNVYWPAPIRTGTLARRQTVRSGPARWRPHPSCRAVSDQRGQPSVC
jgi:predicted dinucleotide-binding enzyme